MKNTPPATRASSRLNLLQSSRLVRWFLYVMSGLLLIALMSWLTVPSVLKKTLEQQVELQTGRVFKVGEVSFNPLTLTVELSHFVFYEADKQNPAVSADNLLVKASFASIFRLAPVISEIKLTHPSIHVVRRQENGQDITNFSDVIARLAKQPSKGGDPVRYSLSNIQVLDGAIHFDDQVVNKQVQIDALALGVPFISNFSSSTDIFVEPHLSAKVDGSFLELKARTKPFVDSHETILAIDFDRFDVTQILPFLPKALPVKVDSAKFSSQLELHFIAQKNSQNVTLSGTASLNDLALSDQSGAPLVKAEAIKVGIHEANLLTQNIQLDTFKIVQPQIWASLNQQGLLNWLALQAPKTVASADPGDKALGTKVTNKEATAKPEPANATKPVFSLTNFSLSKGVLHWSDAANAVPTLEIQLVNIAIDAQKLSTSEQAEPAEITIGIGDEGKQRLTFSGTADVAHAAVSGQLELADLALADYQPYLTQHLAASVSGVLGFKTHIAVRDANISLGEFSGQVEQLKLTAAKPEYGAFSADKIGIVNLSLATETKQAKIDEIELKHLRGDVFRGADGMFNFVHLIKPNAKAVATNAPPSMPSAENPTIQKTGANAKADAKANASAPWQASIAKISLTDSNLAFADKSVQPAVSVKLDKLSAQLEQVSSQMDQAIKLALQTNINKTGKFSVNGDASTKAAKLNISLDNFAVATLQPYFTEFLNITLLGGTFSTQGQLAWSAPNALGFKGGLRLANLRSLDKLTSDDFLKWKLLQIDGIDVDLKDKQQTITLGKIALNDFYARTILSESGKLNLNDIVVRSDQPNSAKVSDDSNKARAADANAGSTSVAQPVAVAPSPAIARVINIGQISLNGGTINYTDNFIKPHYTMRMASMQGTVGAIHSNVAESAPIDLNGKVDDEAPIAISGSLNPLFAPMLLDIKMTATGVDLPRLTSYSAKYAGYPIIKGKLSLDVEYHIKDNQLSANNSLKLDQLTFGEKNDSPDATSLPVPFLVSLLTDGEGQINLDLPISGTINDPQFSIGGLIVKVLFNVLEKVITSPFSLLSHALGGGSGEEFSYIEFPSGLAVLDDASKAKLDNLASALQQRPALKLDIIGRADLAADDLGLRAQLLERKIRKLKQADSPDVDTAHSVLTPAERAKAIERLYSDAKFDKPRNFLGLTKSLPVEEMEKLIIANTKISEDDLRALAVRRENVVRAYFNDAAHIAPERLFLIAPKLNGTDIKDSGAVTRVDFELKM